MNPEMKFPVVAHHRVIITAASRDDATVQALFKSFDLVEPIAVGNTSSGGKYLSYGMSVRFGTPDAIEVQMFTPFEQSADERQRNKNFIPL